MKSPRQFYQPLAIGAPAPLRDLPVRLERMIHFVPPHIEKMRAKAADLARQVDVVLGNLEDAIPVDAKEAARRGFIEMAKVSPAGPAPTHLIFTWRPPLQGGSGRSPSAPSRGPRRRGRRADSSGRATSAPGRRRGGGTGPRSAVPFRRRVRAGSAARSTEPRFPPRRGL